MGQGRSIYRTESNQVLQRIWIPSKKIWTCLLKNEKANLYLTIKNFEIFNLAVLIDFIFCQLIFQPVACKFISS